VKPSGSRTDRTNGQAGNTDYGRAYHPAAILIPTLLLANFITSSSSDPVQRYGWNDRVPDDYIKVFRMDKKGLAGKFKILAR